MKTYKQRNDENSAIYDNAGIIRAFSKEQLEVMEYNKLIILIEKIVKKEKNEDETKRFIKLFVKAIESKEERQKEMIIFGLYNLYFSIKK